MWKLIAKVLSRPAVRQWLVKRAMNTPYTHLSKGDSLYMMRYWLFNPYPTSSENKGGWRSLLPSIRLHWIVRPDDDRHMHDHPWTARTIILRGWYKETRRIEMAYSTIDAAYERHEGDTAPVLFGEYHRIDEVAPGGCWTMFITWKYQGTWGFLVDGKKVPWREYLGIK